MKSILDPNFRYTSAAKTDIRKTFNRVRREMAAQAESAKVSNVKPIIAKRRKTA